MTVNCFVLILNLCVLLRLDIKKRFEQTQILRRTYLGGTSHRRSVNLRRRRDVNLKAVILLLILNYLQPLTDLFAFVKDFFVLSEIHRQKQRKHLGASG